MSIEFLKNENIKSDSSVFQKMAFNLLKEKAPPTTSNEQWHKSELLGYLKENYKNHPMGRVFVNSEIKEMIPTPSQIVMVNGEYQSNLTKLPPGIEIVRDAKIESIKLNQLNFCSLANLSRSEPLTINILPNCEAKITILNIYTEDLSDSNIFTGFVINGGRCCNSVIYESHQFIGKNSIHHFASTFFQLNLEEMAKIELVQNFNLSNESLFVTNNYFHLKRNAQMKLTQFLLNAKIIRNEVFAYLMEEDAAISLNGLSVATEKSQTDTHTNTYHLKSHTKGEQLYKNLISGEAISIFDGQITVHPDAQKVSSTQLNKNLILSKSAHVFTRPQLKVAAHDIKCSHGSTIGQISEEEYFYLQSRGIDRVHAKGLLSHAFGEDIIKQVNEKSLHKIIKKNLDGHLKKEGP